MKICLISDTHNRHTDYKIEPCDLLIHAGDFTNMGHPREVYSFINWLNTVPAKNIAFIAGNHELSFDKLHSYYNDNLKNDILRNLPPHIHYLEDSEIEIEGLKIYGTPWTPIFYYWAFNANDVNQCDDNLPSLNDIFSRIPTGLDFLISHGPPSDILDKNRQGDHCGSQSIKDHTLITAPKYMICGHIHEAAGSAKLGNTKVINAASFLRANYIEL